MCDTSRRQDRISFYPSTVAVPAVHAYAPCQSGRIRKDANSSILSRRREAWIECLVCDFGAAYGDISRVGGDRLLLGIDFNLLIKKNVIIIIIILRVLSLDLLIHIDSLLLKIIISIPVPLE